LGGEIRHLAAVKIKKEALLGKASFLIQNSKFRSSFYASVGGCKGIGNSKFKISFYSILNFEF
jgi:hypothetical protein